MLEPMGKKNPFVLCSVCGTVKRRSQFYKCICLALRGRERLLIIYEHEKKTELDWLINRLINISFTSVSDLGGKEI